MNKEKSTKADVSLNDDKLTYKKLKLNYKRNKQYDQTELLDLAADSFEFVTCRDQYWNPEKFSLLYGTPFWDQASVSEKLVLNQLYWVAYYSQIISAEIATIFLNQAAAAGMYGLSDFRLVCETLDFESMQERAHINAFKKISDETEMALLGEHIFSYKMRPYFYETMIFQNTNIIKSYWKRLQIQFYSLLSSGNAFIACQYLTIRGLRTLNGKIIQDQLSQFYIDHQDQENAPVPSKVSYHHFLDESYHFNSSNLIGSDVLKILKAPTAFEKKIANMGVAGSLKDHQNFTTTVNGIFWYDPATFDVIYRVLRSRVFNMDHKAALNMMELCYCQENQGAQEGWNTHQVALESYKNYLAHIDYLTDFNRSGGKMNEATFEKHLKQNILAFKKYKGVKRAA